MENIVNKFGGYDFWVIMFPGIVCVWGTKNYYKICFFILNRMEENLSFFEMMSTIQLYVPEDIYSLLGLLICSYLVGTIMHEMSRVIKKAVFKNGKPTELLLNCNGKVFSCYQIQKMQHTYDQLLRTRERECYKVDTKEKSKYIFNRMNHSLQNGEKANRYVKLNIIYNMCMSLATVQLYFFVLVSFFVIMMLKNGMNKWIVYFSIIQILLLITFFIFVNRGIQFFRYWTRAIVYSYDNEIRKTEENNEKS